MCELRRDVRKVRRTFIPIANVEEEERLLRDVESVCCSASALSCRAFSPSAMSRPTRAGVPTAIDTFVCLKYLT